MVRSRPCGALAFFALQNKSGQWRAWAMPGIGFRLILNWPAKPSFGGAFQREDSVCHSEMPGVRALQVDDAPQRVGACAPLGVCPSIQP
jgi:hypothetical protein